jgi:hypothetical protein
MKKLILLGVALVLTVTLAGCGGGGDSAPATAISQVFSNPDADGDIAHDPGPPETFTISTASTTLGVVVGIAPLSVTEYRGFLDFPLSGAGGVPANATIVSATLDVFINQVLVAPPATTVPIQIDLVSFQPPILIADDFSSVTQPSLTSRTFNIFSDDAGSIVPIDVTPLMREAQRLGLPDFQVRLLLDITADSGQIEIDDRPTVNATAPLLTVEYF